MSDADRKAALERLSQRIDAAKGSDDADRPKIEEHHSQAQLAWRMVIELVVGIAVGFGMGYGMDALFGTMPLFLVVMTLLGFVAGVRTMLRSAEEVQKEAAKHASQLDEEQDVGR